VSAAADVAPEQAAFLLVNALAEDPWNTAAQTELSRVLAPAPQAAELDGVRGFATLAFADELVAAPEMLTAYAGCFSGADDATLVVAGDTHEIEKLGSVLDSLGLGDDGGPDMLAVDRTVAQGLAGQVRAVYSRRPQRDALAARVLVDEGRLHLLDELRRETA
jgi:hypothetical protein